MPNHERGNESSIIRKIRDLLYPFKEIGQLITDPEVIQDMERYVRLTKGIRSWRQSPELPISLRRPLLSVEESKDILPHEEDKELRENG